MSNWKLDRRKFITASGSVFLLPMLESLGAGRAFAQTMADPRRFVSIYFPNGTYNLAAGLTTTEGGGVNITHLANPVWNPADGSLSQVNLNGKVIQPFTSNLADITVLKNIRHGARDAYNGAVWDRLGLGVGHGQGPVGWLMCEVPDSIRRTDDASAPSTSTYRGESLDQMIARKVGKPAWALSSVPLNPISESVKGPLNLLSFYKRSATDVYSTPTSVDSSPLDLFNRFLASAAPSQTTTSVTRAAGRNKSILDTDVNDIKELKSKHSRADNVKLDLYFDGLRAIEKQVAPTLVQMPGGGCAAGSAPARGLDYREGDFSNLSARVKALMDLIAIAFACDITRSVTLFLDDEGQGSTLDDAQVPSYIRMPNRNGQLVTLRSQLHGEISHYANPNTVDGPEKCITRDRLYMTWVLYLSEKLKQTTDRSGSRILDNTVIHAGFAIPDGMHHGVPTGGAPAVLVGGRNFLNPGRSLDVSAYDQRDLLFTIGQHLGLGLTSYKTGNKIVPV